jgi:hypothetical protein
VRERPLKRAVSRTAARLGLVDAEGAAHQLGSLKPFNRLGFQLRIGHLHKGEATLAPGIPL